VLFFSSAVHSDLDDIFSLPLHPITGACFAFFAGSLSKELGCREDIFSSSR
jgi:hypothetical protein